MHECSLDSVENISEACNDAFFSVGISQNKIKLDPLDPLGSLTAGDQQFTVIADTEHGNPLTSSAVVASIPSMAQSGVKHLMIEMHSSPEIEELMDRLYQNPPQITAEEFVENSHLFRAEGRDEMMQIMDAAAYTAMIWQAREEGIQIHFVQDDAGFAELDRLSEIEFEQQQLLLDNPELQEFYDKLSDIDSKQEALFESNPGLYDYMQSTSSMPDNGDASYKKLSDEQKTLVDQVENLAKQYVQSYESLDDNMQKLNQQYNQLAEEWIETDILREQARMGVDSEEARAENFIELANGEKSVVIFGADHLDGVYDLNEALDSRLEQEAFQNGNYESFVETQVFAAYETRAAYEAYQSPDAEEPDVIYFANEKEVIVTQEGSNNIEILADTPDVQEPVQQFDKLGH